MNRLTQLREVEEDEFELVPFGDCAEHNELDAFDLMEWQEEIYNKLAAYEDMGLEPAEVGRLRVENRTRQQCEYLPTTSDYEKFIAFACTKCGRKFHTVIGHQMANFCDSCGAEIKREVHNG